MAMEGSRPRKINKLGMKEGSTTTTPQLHDLSDDVLEHILLLLGSGLWLIRAAAVCKRWRAVAADAGFLARFRHVPLLLGHYHSVDNEYEGYEGWSGAGGAVLVPCSPSVVDRRHLSLEFLPDSESWEVADSRGGLLLLSKKRTGEEALWHTGFPDMMVCEPLTERCQAILSPADLKKHDCIAMLLLDGDDGGGIHMSNFRVVAAVDVPLVSVFSSSSGGWRLARNDLLVPAGIHGGYENFLGRANGRLYLAGGEDKDVFVLDETTAAFLLVSFPDNTWGKPAAGCDRWTHRMVGREDGAVRDVRVTRDNDLKVFVQEPGSGEWMLEKLLSLPEATRGLPGRKDYFFGGTAGIVAANKRYILITPAGTTWLFTVELDAMQVESQHERNKFPGEAYPYELPWPPSLQACIHHN